MAHEWDWEPGEKIVADLGQWSAQFEWIEEPQVSPDGEKVAAVVNTGSNEFDVCVNSDLWGTAYDRIWYLRYSPDGRLTALISDMGEYTLCVDGAPWEERFAFIWDTKFSEDSITIATAQNVPGRGNGCHHLFLL